jgi:hypothetical protein
MKARLMEGVQDLAGIERLIQLHMDIYILED